MARGTPHTDKTRALVTAALLAGQGVREVARALKVPVATVSRIKKELAAPRAAKALASEATAKATANEEFAPDDSETFDEDVEAAFRADDWQDSDDPEAIFEALPRDERYVCPIERPGVEQVGTQKKAPVSAPLSLDQLIFDLLAENLQTLRDQAVIARDPRWIKRYSPESLAVLHGVMSDKVLRILEFAEAAKPLEQPTESPGENSHA